MTSAETVPADEIEVGQLIDQRPISGLQKRVINLGSMASFIDGYDIQGLGQARAIQPICTNTAVSAARSPSLLAKIFGIMILQFSMIWVRGQPWS